MSCWPNQLAIAAIFSVITISYISIRRRRFNASVSILVSGFVLISLAATGIFAAGAGLFLLWKPTVRQDDGRVVCTLLNIFAEQCDPIIYSIGRLQLVGLVFACLVWILYFILFNIAIREFCRRRARHRRRRRKGLKHEHWHTSELLPRRRHDRDVSDLHTEVSKRIRKPTPTYDFTPTRLPHLR